MKSCLVAAKQLRSLLAAAGCCTDVPASSWRPRLESGVNVYSHAPLRTVRNVLLRWLAGVDHQGCLLTLGEEFRCISRGLVRKRAPPRWGWLQNWFSLTNWPVGQLHGSLVLKLHLNCTPSSHTCAVGLRSISNPVKPDRHFFPPRLKKPTMVMAKGVGGDSLGTVRDERRGRFILLFFWHNPGRRTVRGLRIFLVNPNANVNIFPVEQHPTTIPLVVTVAHYFQPGSVRLLN